jgi:hypothetical protein
MLWMYLSRSEGDPTPTCCCSIEYIRYRVGGRLALIVLEAASYSSRVARVAFGQGSVASFLSPVAP